MIATQPFGRTGHTSTRLIFGAAALGKVSQEEADRTLEILLQYGINHIDVAAVYGEAEERIGPWMAQHRHTFFLATKTWNVPGSWRGKACTGHLSECIPITSI